MKLLVYGVTVVVIRPIESLPELVNHSAPSGPAVIPCGMLMPGKIFTWPAPEALPRASCATRLPESRGEGLWRLLFPVTLRGE